MPDLLVRSFALLSHCGTYRHWLWREWGDGPTCGFVMLNPSTADAENDDPTIRRCIGFARREGCGSLIVGNLYQLRATDPRELRRHPDPVGPHADHYLLDVAEKATGPLIAAWGAHGGERGEYVTAMIGKHMHCLGKTRTGAPKHPLYLPANTDLQPLSEAAAL